MNITSQHLDLISRIYDVVLDQDRWPDILEDIAQMANAKFSNLLLSDFAMPEVKVESISSSVYDPELLREFHEKCADAERFMAEKLLDYPAGELVSDERLCQGVTDYRTLPAVPYLRERYGVFRRIATRLNDTRVWFDAINFGYDEGRGLMTAAESEAVGIFIPHVANALKLSRPFQVLKSRFKGVLTVLDRFHIGVFVLSESGSVVIKNMEAERILDLKDGLSIDPNNRLRATSEDDGEGLLAAIDAATATAHGEAENRGHLITIERRSGQDSFLVEVAPLMRSQVEFHRSFRGALVLIIDPVNRAVISTKGMEKLYDLSKTESLVCGMLVDGYDTQDIADTRNVSRETIRVAHPVPWTQVCLTRRA